MQGVLDMNIRASVLVHVSSFYPFQPRAVPRDMTVLCLVFKLFLHIFVVCLCMHTQECVYARGEGRGQSGFFLNCSLVFLLGDRARTKPGKQWFDKPSWQVSIRWPPVWPHSAGVAGSCLHVELLHGCSTSEPGPQACTTGTHWLNHLPGQHDRVPREGLYKDKLIEWKWSA